MFGLGIAMGDEVLDPTRHGLPVAVHDSERLVTLAHRVHDDPERHQIVNLVEHHVLRLHFLVNGVEVLGASRDFRFDPGLGKFLGQDFDHVLDVALPLGLLLRDVSLELIVDLGV